MVNSLTGFLDPILNYFARLAGLEGIQAETYKGMTGGEFVATVIEWINDMIFKGWLNKAVNAFIALVTGIITFKLPLNPRLKSELLALGNHLLSRIVDAKPSDYEELASSIRTLIDAIKLGDYKLALRSGLRSIEEHMRMLRSLGLSVPGRTEITLRKETTPTPAKKTREIIFL